MMPPLRHSSMLSIVSAVDLDLLTQEKSKILISHMLDTLENLEKWKGHLYNWYSTETARPLEPRYVSTVDSGNLRGCLIALREGLYQWGESVEWQEEGMTWVRED